MFKSTKSSPNVKQIGEVIRTVSNGLGHHHQQQQQQKQQKQHQPKHINIVEAWEEVWRPEMSFKNPSADIPRRQRENSVSSLAPSRNMVHMTPLPKLLSIFLFWMKLCGLYHVCDDLKASDGNYTIKNCLILIAEKGMSLVVIITCWGIVIFNLFHFPFEDFGFDSNVFTCVVYLAFFVQNAISATIYFIASAHGKMFRKLFRRWSALLVPEDVADDIARYCNIAQWIVLCVGFIITGLIITVFVEMFFVQDDLEERFFAEEFQFSTSESEIYGVLAIISAFIWVFSLGFFVLICTVMRRLFYSCHKALCRDIHADCSAVELETYRVRHESINSILDVVDKIYGEMIFFYFFNYMLLLCLISYEILWMKSSRSTFLIRGVWCFISVGTILVICFAASSINGVAHKSFKYLHRMSLVQLKGGTDIQLVAYMLRLNGPPLGLTAWGIFTVTREVILTMASVFMTYLLILAQLKPTSNVKVERKYYVM